MSCLARLLAFLRNPVAGWTAAADELWAAAAWPRDGAQRLADAEAERDVAEPAEGPCLGGHAGCDGSFEQCYDDDPIADCHVPNPADEWTFVVNGEPYKISPDPGVMDVERVFGQTAFAAPKTADSDRLDQLIALLEDVRNLLQHNKISPADGEAARCCGPAAEERPASNPQTGAGHPTSHGGAYVWCSAQGPYDWTECSKPIGHPDQHGYAGISWDDSTPK